MPTASKVLVVCVLVVSIMFIWLSASVLEARRQWDLKVKAKAEEVAKTNKEIDILINGSEEFDKDFDTNVVTPIKTLWSSAADTEYKKQVSAGIESRVAFEAAMNLFVDKKTVETFQDAVKRLNDVQKAPIPDEIEREAAVKAFDAAAKDMAATLKNLDDAYAIFLGQSGGLGGIRALAGKGMSVDALRQTVVHIRQIIYHQRAVFNIVLSDGQKNETRMKDLVAETQFEANTLQQAAANGQQQLEDRTKEVDDLKLKLSKEKMDLANEETKRDKAIGELDDLKQRFSNITQKTKNLALKVREFEIRIDAQRGIKNVVLDDKGRVPEGKIQKVNEQDGTAEINIGTRVNVKPGVQLHVYRWAPEAKYLGIMEILKSESDTAVGRMLPEYRQLSIQPNDNVSPEIMLPQEKRRNSN